MTKAKKSIAIFKLREGQKIGAMVTLRREQMYEFFDRLVNFALPRVRDFKGVSPKAFDGRGNYTLGIREQIIFPEINFEKVDKPKGMNITFTTTAAPTSRAGRCCGTSGCRSGANHGQDCRSCHRPEAAEVARCVTATVPAVRASARVSAQVRAVPHLLPALALRGDIPASSSRAGR